MPQRNRESRFRKFEPIGGIDEVSMRYCSGQLTLGEIARGVFVTRQCVSADLIEFLGSEKYKLVSNLKKSIRQKRTKPIVLRSDCALVAIENPEQNGIIDSAAMLLSIRHIIVNASKSEIGLNIILTPEKKICLSTENGQLISVRSVSLEESVSDANYGLHRFKITSSASVKFTYIIFLMHSKFGIQSYLFKESDISNLKSLVLRFGVDVWKSKYHDAFENWRILEDE